MKESLLGHLCVKKVMVILKEIKLKPERNTEDKEEAAFALGHLVICSVLHLSRL